MKLDEAISVLYNCTAIYFMTKINKHFMNKYGCWCFLFKMTLPIEFPDVAFKQWTRATLLKDSNTGYLCIVDALQLLLFQLLSFIGKTHSHHSHHITVTL